MSDVAQENRTTVFIHGVWVTHGNCHGNRLVVPGWRSVSTYSEVYGRLILPCVQAINKKEYCIDLF